MIYELLSANIKDVYQTIAAFKGRIVAEEIKEKYEEYNYLTIKIAIDANNQPITIVKCYHNGSIELLFLKKIVMAYMDCLIKIEIMTYQNSDNSQEYDYNDYCIIKPTNRLINISSLYDVNIIDLTVRYKGNLLYLEQQFKKDENIFFGYLKNEEQTPKTEYTFVFLIHPDINTVNHFINIFNSFEKQRDAISYQQYHIPRNVKAIYNIDEIPKKDLVDIVVVMKNNNIDKIQQIKDNMDKLLDISILSREYIPYAFVEIVFPNVYELDEMKKILLQIGKENIIKIMYTDFIKQNESIYMYPEDENRKMTQEEIDKFFDMSDKIRKEKSKVN